jgi:ABC-type lipoprotein export system ATPase subunit
MTGDGALIHAIAITGSSGSEKTTLMNLIGLLDQPPSARKAIGMSVRPKLASFRNVAESVRT